MVIVVYIEFSHLNPNQLTEVKSNYILKQNTILRFVCLRVNMSFGSKNEKNSNSRSIICQGNLEGRIGTSL